MKNRVRLLAFLLCFALLLSAPAFAAALGEPVLGGEGEIAAGLNLAEGVHLSGDTYREEHYLEYTPSQDIVPLVVYGSKLCNYGSFSNMAKLLEAQGYHVLGGINGDYYDVATYCPLGIVIADGRLISSDAGHYALGFLADGTALVGSPALEMTLQIGGESYPLGSVNKIRDGQEFALFTDDFASTTKNSGSGLDLILSVTDGGKLAVDCTLTLQVEEILASDGAAEIPEGKMILSLADSADSWRRSALESLQPGDRISLSVSCPDSRWKDVQFASGALHKLVTAGEVEESLPGGVEPRTAAGVKADGSLILYTVDGRQSGYSEGATMRQVAQRLAELGCVEACLLDGGGSTSLFARHVGADSLRLINSPSGGSARSVTSYIMLATKKSSGSIAYLGLTPRQLYMLAGARTTLTAGAADSYGRPMSLISPRWGVENAVGGVNQEGVFVAGSAAGSGAVQVYASGRTALAQVQVLETPHRLTVKNEADGKTVTALELEKGAAVNLSAVAGYYNRDLIAQDHCFTWSLRGGIGTIDVNGSFRAGNADAEGSILVRAGELQVEIPVTVGWVNPFDDISETEDWYYDQIKYVCRQGLFSGETPTHFNEEAGMTRAMFVTVLWRIAGMPTAAGSAFDDVAPEAYYAQAVNWAAEKGIVSGYGEGIFLPDKTITRQEICALLQNYAAWAGISLQGAEQVSFADQDQIADWAKAGVEACVSAGLVKGESNPDGSFTMSPQKTMSRSHSAVLLARFHSAYFS